ncbi:MAG: hypothetical protein J2P57_23100, partial [Acidimicrobiaceae bacterium]|nr:hypothetical protein [Acidimicrobiaceae bacterium]
DEVVPHLTIGHASDGVELAPVATAIAPLLPVKCRADEVWVMVSPGPKAPPGPAWKVQARVPLRSPGANR